MTIDHGSSPDIECPCNRTLLNRVFTYDAPPEGETKFDWSGQEYCRGYDRCGACGHWFSSHNLDMSNLYSGDYVQSTYGEGMATTFERIVGLPRHRSDNAGRRDRLMMFAREQFADSCLPRLLDIGSGLGVFPYIMKEAGWDCTALDPDPRATEHISARTGVMTITADFLEFDLSPLGLFDVVTLNKVIEHVDRPCEMLRRAAQVTRYGGFVYVEVPDGDAAASHGQDREEFFVEHHHLFSTSSLSAIVERSGLRVLQVHRIVEPSGKFTLLCFATPSAAD